MDLNKYQDKAWETANYPVIGKSFVYPAIGLSGEAGEISEKVKKIFRDENGEISDKTRDSLERELGDVLWYIACLSRELGLSLQEVAETNLEKLKDRKARDAINGDGDYR